MKAIVLGSTGFLGKALVNALINENIPVCALTRRDLTSDFFEISDKSKANLLMIQKADANEIDKLEANDQITEFTKEGDCVFYNLAWKGNSRLRDGSLAEQFANVTRASNAVITAAKIGCSKFIHVSTQDEVLYSDYLKDWKDRTFNKNDMPYAAAKLAAKEMCLIEAYINKIDFVNTRFSAVIDKELSSPSFIVTNLKNIKEGKEFVIPSNPLPLEINYLSDLAKAYVAIGKFGKNKGDYYIGQGELHTIKDYFLMAKSIKDNAARISPAEKDSPICSLFDNSTFINDTNFKFEYTFKTMMEDILS